MLLYLLSYFVVIRFTRAEESLATTHDPASWSQASAYLMQGVNTSADPCENFYDYACGSYETDPNVKDETSLINEYKDIQRKLKQSLSDVATFSSASEPEKAAITFYKQCVAQTNDSDRIEKVFRALSPIFASAESNSNADPWAMLGKLERRLGLGIFVKWVVAPGPSVWFHAANAANEKICRLSYTDRQLVFDNIYEQAAKTGLEPKKFAHLHDWSRVIKEICEDLNKLPKDIKVDSSPLIPIEKADTAAPNFAYKAYIDGLFNWIPTGIRFYVQQEALEKVFEQLGTIFQHHGADKLQTFVYLTAALDLCWPSVALVELREDQCLQFMQTNFAPPLTKLVFRQLNIDPLQYQYETSLLVNNIFAAFRLYVNTVPFLDVEDKVRVLRKLDTIKVHTGIPTWINDIEEVKRRTYSYDESLTFIENRLAVQLHKIKSSYYRMNSRNFEADPFSPEEGFPSFSVNARYLEEYNSMFGHGPELVTNIGLLLTRAFNPKYPLAVNYGGIGYRIGHELLHAFDTTHIRSKLSDGRSLVKNSSLLGYKAQEECINREYSSYCSTAPPEMCLKGDSLDENIADVVGMKVAYTAYKFLTHLQGVQPSLTEFPDRTMDQIFFVSQARFLCQKGGKAREFHAAKVRVDVALKMIPTFAKAYGCSTPSKYAVQEPCKVWGDIEKLDSDKFVEREEEKF